MKQKGFSVLEIILAVSIFITFGTGAIMVVVQGFNSNRLGIEFTIANQFASEGIEAVKSIKNQSFAGLVNTGGCGLVRSGIVWAFQSPCTNNTLTHNAADDYIRIIKVEPVNRNNIPPKGDIVPVGSPDPDTKKITSTVTWYFNSSRPESIDLVTYLSDWRKPIVSGGPIMMAYSKTTNTPFYRIWNGTSWSVENPAQNVGGNINYLVLKSSRTRNEAILGTLDSNGNIYAQVWNGTNWVNLQLMANLGSTNAATRSFDMAYEKNGDRLVFVYPTGAGNVDFAYRIWDGSNWSASTTVTAPPTTAIVRWIEMTENPLSTSNDIAMIMMDNNAAVYGMVWNGSSWVNMGVSTSWDLAGIATEKAIDVAYEQNSGRVLFIWGDTVVTDQYYRIWNGSTLTAPTLLDIASSGGVANWIELVSRPNSNEIMYGVLDAGSDLNTRKWNGISAWDSATQHPRHTAGAENNSSMVFDLIWETHSANPGKAWLLMGNSNVVQKKQWSGTAWSSATTLTGSDDTSFIRLKADPVSGAVFAGIYEDLTSGTDDIWESRLTGGGSSWSAKNTIWGGSTSATPVFFRIDIATP